MHTVKLHIWRLQQLHWRFGSVENFGLVVELYMWGPWCGALRDCGLDSAEVSKPTVPTSRDPQRIWMAGV